MQLSQNIEMLRATGTLDIELADGRVATLGIDVDLSQHGTEFRRDHEYAERVSWPTLSLGRVLSTTYSVKIPTSSSREDGGATWTLRIPIEEDGQ